MSLLDDIATECILMEMRRVPDGAGGSIKTWEEGIHFINYIALDTSIEARIAEKQGVSSVYSVLVDQAVPLEYKDVFKDVATGNVYRITSNPDERKTPVSSNLNLKFFTAERWELPQ